MATIDLGKIKQVFRGTYNNATAYVPDDLVTFTDGQITSTYICTTASTGNNPSSGGTAHANWAFIAKGVADPIPSQSGQSGKFLTTNGSALSFGEVSAGITDFDTWILTGSFNGSVDPIQNNLSRYTQNGANYLGTGMSVSSGIWTFPSTGYWRITVKFRSQRNSGHQSKYQKIEIKSSTDNFSSSNILAVADSTYYDNYATPGRQNSGSASIIFDCTNTSTHKIRFAAVTQDNSSNGNEFLGSSTVALTTFEFIKLADT